MMGEEVSCVDLEGFLLTPRSEEAAAEAAAALVHGLSTHGMVRLRGHGVSVELLRDAIETLQRLFSIKDSDKAAAAVKDDASTRGFLLTGQESGSQQYESKEGFSYGKERNKQADGEPRTESGLRLPNRWPESLSMRDRHTLNRLYEELCSVAFTLVKAIVYDLKGAYGSLAEMCEQSVQVSIMRCFRYFKMQNSSHTGSSAHTDWGFLTVILPEPGKLGLELSHNGKWFQVCSEPYELIVNCGDFLSVYTKSLFVSPLHRVSLGSTERLSFVLFYYPNYALRLPNAGGLENAAGNLSIFTDQKQGSAKVSSEMLALPFGDFILSKWKQVSRKSS
eukprot:Plantae.Rhodophyta-Purpureofilum_apyrenoidigerum.ctg9800.p1 GENE.Plantae.Rhodophyta-Purpureofilum_apyrenoidigerum.ctg9800~~Plantae.Rhodophyta-Purpureofilum_apyrenoidigerum.ctg9800.p1  ORF type:complete len:335 (-),score=35.22 Plantae.Rhodophyta-Purpureofilum_apyrenoidigerum.ctg9800:258-1262(-)